MKNANKSSFIPMRCSVCRVNAKYLIMSFPGDYNTVEFKLCMLDELLTVEQYFFMCDNCSSLVSRCTNSLELVHNTRALTEFQSVDGCFLCGTRKLLNSIQLKCGVGCLMVLQQINGQYNFGTEMVHRICSDCEELYTNLGELYNIIRRNPKYKGDAVTTELCEINPGKEPKSDLSKADEVEAESNNNYDQVESVTIDHGVDRNTLKSKATGKNLGLHAKKPLTNLAGNTKTITKKIPTKPIIGKSVTKTDVKPKEVFRPCGLIKRKTIEETYGRRKKSIFPSNLTRLPRKSKRNTSNKKTGIRNQNPPHTATPARPRRAGPAPSFPKGRVQYSTKPLSPRMKELAKIYNVDVSKLIPKFFVC